MSAPDGPPPLESNLLRRRIQLYLYGELGFAERSEIDCWLEQDPEFRELFLDERAFLESLSASALGPEPEPLLDSCREALGRAVAEVPAPCRRRSLLARASAARSRVAAWMAARPLAWQAVGATAMLAIGFLAGRAFSPRAFLHSLSAPAAAADRTLTGIEAVRLDPVSDRVRIVIEERRAISGVSSDPTIRGMLLDTVQGAHAGARLTSLDALRVQASDRDVREAMLQIMLGDDDVGVRLKAFEAVEDYASQPDVREALVQTLHRDRDPGMRVHAIQLLREHPGRDVAGPLQELVERESDPLVLQETLRILDALGASMERY